MKFKLRKIDFLLIPIVGLSMYFVYKYSLFGIDEIQKEELAQKEKIIKELKNKCIESQKQGTQTNYCEEYSKMIYQNIK